eukprot:2046764-Amphidinium_carterae.1
MVGTGASQQQQSRFLVLFRFLPTPQCQPDQQKPLRPTVKALVHVAVIDTRKDAFCTSLRMDVFPHAHRCAASGAMHPCLPARRAGSSKVDEPMMHARLRANCLLRLMMG